MFDELPTEAWNAASADLDLRDTTELVALMTTEDASVPAAVERASAAIVEAIDAVADRLARGGRLIYVGAGTSGRLALVDAVECESTFAVPPGLVIALVAGGATSAATAQEHAEDDGDAGASEIAAVAGRPARRRRRAQRERQDAVRERVLSRWRARPARSRSRSSPCRSPSSGGWPITRSRSSSAPR